MIENYDPAPLPGPIDWNAPDWGGHVHVSGSGSWLDAAK